MYLMYKPQENYIPKTNITRKMIETASEEDALAIFFFFLLRLVNFVLIDA